MTIPTTQSTVSLPPIDPIAAALEDPQTSAILLQRIRFQTAKWYGSKRTLHDQVCQDVLSDLRMRVFKKKGDFDPKRGTTPLGWILGFLPHILKEYGRGRTALPVQVSEGFDTPAKIEKQFNDIAEDVEFYLDFLTSDDRRLVTMYHLEQRSHREISVLLREDYDLVRKRFSRAMLKLMNVHAQREGQS